MSGFRLADYSVASRRQAANGVPRGTRNPELGTDSIATKEHKGGITGKSRRSAAEADDPQVQLRDSNLQVGHSKLGPVNPKVQVGNPRLQVGNYKVGLLNPKVQAGNPNVQTGNPKVEIFDSKVEVCDPQVEPCD